MAAQIFGSSATVVEMNLALFGTTPSNAVYTNQLGVVGTNNANLASYVNQITNANFAGSSDSGLATAVLTNLLGADASNTAGLNAALTQLLAANPANRGVVIYQVATILTQKEGDATFGTAAAAFNNQVLNGNNYSILPTSTVAIVPGNTPAPVQGQTFVLTTSVDAPVGGAGDDTFVGTEATLSSADILSGGAGNDTLRFASSGAVAVNKAGFSTTSIEKALVTSDATGGTTFDVTGMVGTTSLVNDNSSTDVIFNGAANIMSAALQNVSGGNTQFIYQSSVVSGSNDTMNIALSNNKTIDGQKIGSVTANGIENIVVTTSGGASNLQELGSVNALKSLTISGDQNLTLNAANFYNTAATNTVDASKLTGALNLNLTNDGVASIAVAVTGGSGNDRVSFTTFDKGDSFTGGFGTDTIALTNAVAIATPAGTLSGVETLEDIGDAGAGANGTINMSNFAGVTNVYLSTGLGGATGVSNATTGLTETVNVGTRAAADLSTTLKTDGTADAITLQLNNVNKASTVGNLNDGGFETVNLNAAVDPSLNGAGALTIANLNDTAATTLNINSAVNLTLTASATGALTKVDASASTGNLTLNSLSFAATGATILGGKGNDTFTPGNGADTITLGGGADVLTYTTPAQSNDKMDIVTDFTSGTDKLNLAGLGLIGSAQYLGARASFGLAQGALTAGGNISAVLDSSTNILWLDSDGDGTLDNHDWRIQLNGVTSLSATNDLNLAASGTGITLTANAANVSKTLVTNASGSTTDLGDTISSKIAFLGSTVDGANGNDTLAVTDAGTITVSANFTNIEALTLATVAATANSVNAFANVAGNSFKSVTGSDNADVIASTKYLVAGGTVALGAGVDQIQLLDVDTAAINTSARTLNGSTFDMGAGDDLVTVGSTITTANLASTKFTLAGGAGADTLTLSAAADLSAATVTGFETFANAGFAVSLTGAEVNSFTTALTGAGMITLTDSVAIADTATSTSANYTLGSAGQSFTGNANVAYAITAGAGADTFTFTGLTGATAITVTGGGAGDKLVYSANTTAAIDVSGAAGVPTFSTTVNETGGSIKLGTAMTTVDLSAQTTALTLDTNTAALTSLKLGASNDTVNKITTGATASTVDMGAGNDTITSLVTGAGTAAITFGAGNDTITDFTTHGAGAVTLKFGVPAGTETLTFAATTANIAVGDVFDFATNATAIVSGLPTGATGIAGGNGQVFVDVTGGNTTITFDADGSRTFSVGDIQIVVTGNALTFGIDASGNLVVATSA
jgi:hypothetical protein